MAGVTARTAYEWLPVIGIVSFWDTEADREASDSAVRKTREEAVELVGGDLVGLGITIQHAELRFHGVGGPAA